jgi:hypothetical protein
MLIADFMNRTDWAFYTSKALEPETQVDMAEVWAGTERQLYTTKKYHKIHCMYMWYKMHAVILDGLPVDSDMSAWIHTGHCDRVLLEEIFHEGVGCTPEMICPTMLIPIWTSCGYI